tara:strand:- start:899 stop:1150 length:252 start_codon:yes stop_codon:yes gene_type:complete
MENEIYNGTIDIDKVARLFKSHSPKGMNKDIKEATNLNYCYISEIKNFKKENIKVLSMMVDMCLENRRTKEAINKKLSNIIIM